MILQILDTVLSKELLLAFIFVVGGLAGGVIGALIIRYLGELILKVFGFILGGLAAIWLLGLLSPPWAAF